MTELVPIPPAPIATDHLDDLQDEARVSVAASRSLATMRAYASDSRSFTSWCDEHRLNPLPAEASTVALYMTDLAHSAKTATIRRRMSSISVTHQAAGHASPTADILVRPTWSGIRRTNGVAQTAKAALLTDDIRKMVDAVPDSLLGKRDACLLLLGFASALRRSELVALDATDVHETRDGLVITVTRSKTDKEGEGRQIGIPYGSNPTTCPVRTRRSWLDASGIEHGPLFRPIDRHGHLGTGNSPIVLWRSS
ncbi:MAG: integrase family protein [Actinomycetia bacterium]|nr:integrase family protein [Actinomycetes bacterium]